MGAKKEDLTLEAREQLKERGRRLAEMNKKNGYQDQSLGGQISKRNEMEYKDLNEIRRLSVGGQNINQICFSLIQLGFSIQEIMKEPDVHSLYGRCHYNPKWPSAGENINWAAVDWNQYRYGIKSLREAMDSESIEVQETLRLFEGTKMLDDALKL
ncbi:MAG TPA: hypothetical protein DIT39_00320 [Tissierellales bacterium]|nr:hypothetical protein [Tissierellales bacterium]